MPPPTPPPTTHLRVALSALFLLLAHPAVATAAAQPENIPAPATLRHDPTTGRDLANWPPSPHFDHLRMSLEIDIPDLEEPRFTAVQTLRLRARGVPRAEIRLDAGATLDIQSVAVDGNPVPFEHAAPRLRVPLPQPAEPGRETTVKIAYTATRPFSEGSGLNWFRTRRGREAQGPQIYSQGQSQWNHLWFPCHDFPNVRASTEITVTLPAGPQVVSNGRLVSVGDAPGGRKVWHWLQERPHPYYLVSLAIGTWDVVELGGPGSARPDLAMPVYGPPGSAERLPAIFGRTPEMIAHFESLFAEPYPWDKYAQVLVRNFQWGGMENTSATTLSDFQLRADPGAMDDLIAHELVHQWFGNLVTCRSWEHAWLNEGWASFGEALWAGKRDGEQGYLRVMRAFATSMRSKRIAPPPDSLPMASRLYAQADDPFTKPDDIYAKGALVLHMLRERLGDDAFWAGARLYLDRHKDGVVETADFRRAMEDASGESLDRFFAQWTRRPGYPAITIEATFDAAAGRLDILARQTQPIDADNPAWDVSVPVVAVGPQGGRRTLTLDFDTREARGSIELPAAPLRLLVDPRLRTLARYTLQTNFGAGPGEPAADPRAKPSDAAPEAEAIP